MRRVSYDKQPCLHGQPSDPVMQKWRRVRSTSRKRKRSADEVTLKYIKRNVQARRSAEKMSDQSTLNVEVPEKISSSPTGDIQNWQHYNIPNQMKPAQALPYQKQPLQCSSAAATINRLLRSEANMHSNAVEPSSDVYCKPHEKIVKVTKNKITEKDICKSLAAANALELLKLIFLSRSSTSDNAMRLLEMKISLTAFLRNSFAIFLVHHSRLVQEKRLQNFRTGFWPSKKRQQIMEFICIQIYNVVKLSISAFQYLVLWS
ncbi:hypothetical protein EJB05_20666, partial [Eragrostis curvula]